MRVEFDNQILHVRKSDKHDWIMDTNQVAKGYGVTPNNIRHHKKQHSRDLVFGKHYLSVNTNKDSVGLFKKGDSSQLVSVINIDAINKNTDLSDTSNTGAGSKSFKRTFWTKRGVARLAFYIKTEQAKKFLDWAEDLIVSTPPPPVIQTLSPAQQLLQNAQLLVDLEQEQQSQRQAIEELKSKVGQENWYSISGYAARSNITINLSQAMAYGKQAAKLCKERGIRADRIAHPRYGSVGVYPIEILEEIVSV